MKAHNFIIMRRFKITYQLNYAHFYDDYTAIVFGVAAMKSIQYLCQTAAGLFQ